MGGWDGICIGLGEKPGLSVGQVVVGQVGRMPKFEVHRGCILPSTHWQVHSADAGASPNIRTTAAADSAASFMVSPALRFADVSLIPQVDGGEALAHAKPQGDQQGPRQGGLVVAEEGFEPPTHGL